MRKFVFLDAANMVKCVVQTTDPKWVNKDITLNGCTQREIALDVAASLGSIYDGAKFMPPPPLPIPSPGRDALAEIDALKAKLKAAGMHI